MAKFRKILAAVDGSDASKNAFRQTCMMARQGDGMITALMSLPVYQDQFDVLSTKEKVTEALRAEGEKVLAGIREIAREEHVPVRAMFDEGSPYKVITETAEQGEYDLIVMGRRGMNGVERAMMGSVTERVIGHTGRAVLVVPGAASVAWKSILVATDGSRSGDFAVTRAINFAEAYNARLTVVTVADINEEYYALAPSAADTMVKNAKAILEKVREQAEERGVPVETRVLEGEPYRKILELADEKKADLIFMSSHGRTGLMRMFMGSVAAKVIGHSSCPVMVIKDPALVS